MTFYMSSYLLVIVFMWLGSTILKIQLSENIMTLIWPFKVNLGHEGNWKFTYDFLSVGNSIYVAGKHHFEDTAVWKYHDLDLTFQDQPKITTNNKRVPPFDKIFHSWTFEEKRSMIVQGISRTGMIAADVDDGGKTMISPTLVSGI